MKAVATWRNIFGMKSYARGDDLDAWCVRGVTGGKMILAVLCLLLSAVCSTALAQFKQPGPSSPLYGARPQSGTTSNGLPPALRDVRIEQRLNEQVPLELEFLDEAGRTVQLREYFGSKPVVLALVFYECPMLCNQVLNGLVSSLRTLSFDVGKQFEVLTVSFDPRETPAQAAAKKQTYLQQYKRSGAAEGWHFLTGDEASIKRLTEAVGFRYHYDAAKDQFAHASGIMVLTPEGKLSHYFYGIEYAPKDLRLALVESSANKIGSPVDQLLLYCYHYDPATGKYGAVVMNIVRLGGVLTLIGIAALLLLLRGRSWRQERLKAGGTA
ncbi:MAG TPA: SCO family protein [Pyrinomonadaceae bacterium]|nr:SCO family protein [Pyrinomonadaceae bacterium]